MGEYLDNTEVGKSFLDPRDSQYNKIIMNNTLLKLNPRF